MNKVAILAVNEKCKDKEEKLVRYLTRRIEEYEGFVVINTADDDTETLVELANEADKVIVVWDALEGNDSSFTYIATQLFDVGIKPILLISDPEKASPEQIAVARNSIANVWGNLDQSLDDSKLYFETLFFSYEKGGVGVETNVENDSVSTLIDFIS